MIKIKALQPYMRLVFIAALIVTMIFMLIPFPPSKSAFIYMDKLQHAFIFIILTCLGSLAYVYHKIKLYIGLVAYGLLIEIMQATLTTARAGDPMDWLADCVGIVMGVALFAAVNKALKHPASKSV